MEYFRDKDGNIISYSMWRVLLCTEKYSLIDINKVKTKIILTEWTGIIDHLFSTKTIEIDPPKVIYFEFSKELVQAKIRHKVTVENIKISDKVLCPLCDSFMKEREGKYGMFWACSNWVETGCPGTRNKNLTVPKKLQDLIPKVKTKPVAKQKVIKKSKKKQVKIIWADPFFDRLANIDFD